MEEPEATSQQVSTPVEPGQRRSRRWQRLVSRGALVRLGLLLAILLAVGAYMTWMPGRSYQDELPPLTEPQRELAKRLEGRVRALADEIGPRNLATPGSLDDASAYVEQAFEQAGYEVQRETYEVEGQTVANLIADLPGTGRPNEIVVAGAHYDSVLGSPGANDNASGVAALLEMAAALRDQPQDRTLRFIAFVNEEPPYFQTEHMGSYVHADRARERADRITAMMSMDGIGYYSGAPSSQQYPVPGIDWLYPETGDFIAFVSRAGDAGLVRQAVGAFREEAAFPSQGAALPGAIPGVGWSDHWAFWQHGYSGFMVTDTLPFRDPQYHGPGDTADRLDYERMARVTEGLTGVLRDLASVD